MKPSIASLFLFLGPMSFSQVYSRTERTSTISPENRAEKDWVNAKMYGTAKEGGLPGQDHLIFNARSPKTSYAGFNILKKGGSVIYDFLAAALSDIALENRYIQVN